MIAAPIRSRNASAKPRTTVASSALPALGSDRRERDQAPGHVLLVVDARRELERLEQQRLGQLDPAALDLDRAEVVQRARDVCHVIRLAKQRKALLELIRRDLELPLRERDVAAVVSREGDQSGLAERLGGLDALIERLRGAFELAQTEQDRAEIAERPDDPRVVAELAVERERALGERSRA